MTFGPIRSSDHRSVDNMARSFEGADANKFVHADKIKGTAYVTDKIGGALVNILAKLEIPFFKRMQQEERSKGADFVLTACVLQYHHTDLKSDIQREMKSEHNVDISKGIKLKHLDQIQEIASRLGTPHRYFNNNNSEVVIPRRSALDDL